MARTGAAPAKATVLLADNDSEWLRQQKDALVSEGFHVLTAAGPSEAEMILKTGKVDAVVLDVRLENDEDDKDVSGLTLMRNTASDVGKVITTRFPDDMTSGPTFKSQIESQYPFVRYVDKDDGLTAVVAAVKKVVSFSFLSRHGWDEFMAEREELALRRRLAPLVMGLLLLALGAGVMAVYQEDMRWLIATIVLAVLSLLFIGKSI